MHGGRKAVLGVTVESSAGVLQGESSAGGITLETIKFKARKISTPQPALQLKELEEYS